MKKSKTKINKQAKRKTNPEVAETIFKAKKRKNWLGIAGLLSGPTRKYSGVNLQEIEKESKEGDTIVIPGKVLGKGDVSKKIRVCALSFSAEAEKKLKARKCEIVSIIKEIEVNPEARGIKILR